MQVSCKSVREEVEKKVGKGGMGDMSVRPSCRVALPGAYREGWAARRLLGAVPGWLGLRGGGVSYAGLWERHGGTWRRGEGGGVNLGRGRGAPELKGSIAPVCLGSVCQGCSWTPVFLQRPGGAGGEDRGFLKNDYI